MATLQRTIAPNSATVSGNISVSGNVDEYALTLTAGLAYEFDIQGQGAGGGTLATPSLSMYQPGVFGADGNSTTPAVGASRITFTPSTTGSYALDVSGANSGTYTLTSTAADDYSSLPSTATTLLPGASISGGLQTYGDTDAFAVNLVAGFSYQWDLYGQGTAFGTIGSPNIGLQPPGSFFVTGNTTNPSTGDARLTYTAANTAAYYVYVSGSTIGTYTLVETPQDDTSANFSSATPITAGTSKTGTFENVADTDAFSINLVAGVTYQFDLEGAGTGAGTSAVPVLSLYSSSGSFATATGTTVSTGDSRIAYTATSTAAYYLSATGGQGTYTLVTASNATTTNAGNTTVTAGGSLSVTSGTANVINVPSGGSVTTASGTANRIVLGSGSSNTVLSGGTDTIIGGTGPATVTTKGSAIVVGGAGAMTLTNGSGAMTAFAGKGGLTYVGGTGTEIVVGTSGPVYVTGGTGGGTYFGGGNSKIVAGSGGQAVMVGYAGDQLYSAGSAGDLFGANAGGDIVMSGASSSGNDVFFGASGTGKLTFIAGSGNDIMGVGQGTNVITLGSGRSTVFANTGTTGVTTITAGSGSADIGMGGKSVALIIAAGSSARTFDLFNFVPGVDKITLSGFSSNAAAAAVAGQTYSNGITTLTLADNTAIQLIGVTRADTSYFG